MSSEPLEEPEQTEPTESEPEPTGDTQTAERLLKLAFSYLDDFIAKDASDDAMTAAYNMAAKKVAEARSHDPDVTIDVIDIDGEEKTLTIDDLAKRALFYEGLYNSMFPDNTYRLEKAEAAFQKALRYEPNDALTHHKLGDVLLNLKRRDEAAVHLREAVKFNPDNMEAQKILDRLEMDPSLGMPASAMEAHGSLLIPASIFLGLFGAYAVFSINSDLGFIIIACSVGLYFVGRHYENKQIREGVEAKLKREGKI